MTIGFWHDVLAWLQEARMDYSVIAELPNSHVNLLGIKISFWESWAGSMFVDTPHQSHIFDYHTKLLSINTKDMFKINSFGIKKANCSKCQTMQIVDYHSNYGVPAFAFHKYKLYKLCLVLILTPKLLFLDKPPISSLPLFGCFQSFVVIWWLVIMARIILDIQITINKSFWKWNA